MANVKRVRLVNASDKQKSLVYNALCEKANGDRKAAQELRESLSNLKDNDGFARGMASMIIELEAQAKMADEMASEVLF